MAESDAYVCHEIRVLEGLEPVRLRPGMYVGDIRDGSGLENLLWSAVDNCIELHIARRASSFRLDVRGHWVEIQDDGPGLSTHYDPRAGVHEATLMLTQLRGPVSLPVVNALSAELELETRSRGRIWRQRFERGRPITELTSYGPTTGTGTRLRFRPDPTVFSSPAFDHDSIARRLRELAYLNPGITIRFGEQAFRERLGLGGWVAELLGDPTRVIEASSAVGPCRIDVAFGWAASGTADVRAFADHALRPWPDAHVAGFWDGLRQAFFAHVGRHLKSMNPAVLQEVVSSGLVARIDVSGLETLPCWRLRSIDQAEMRKLARATVSEALKRKLSSDESFATEMTARFNPAGRCAPPARRSSCR